MNFVLETRTREWARGRVPVPLAPFSRKSLIVGFGDRVMG